MDPVAVVRSLFDAFNDGDLARCAALAADDFELFDAPSGRTFRGPAGLREWLSTFRTALPDARTEVVSAHAEGEHVVTEHIGRGTHEGPFETPSGTIPPTGRPVEIRIAELYEVRDGKLATMRAFYDTTTLMRQLGLLPPEGSGPDRAMTALMGAGVRARRLVRR
ncbi:MAG: ester cyclase [Actinomycetota bacterium]|nr:ester cyclase [Actinomycetota bacterium]